MSKQIDFDRLRELQLAEETLRALEAGGVDNWEGYDIAIQAVKAKSERQEAKINVLEEIMEVLSQGVDYPAGREAGAGFTEEAIERAQMIILGADL